MANPIRGHGGYLGLAEQVAYDTPVAPTHFVTAKSLAIARKIEREAVGILGYPGEAPVAHDSYDKVETVEGTTTHLLGYDDPTMLLLKHCFGAVSTSGAGPFAHEFSLSDGLPSGTEGLTVHQAYGSGSLAQRAETFTGCVVTGFSIEVAYEQMAELEIRWMGKTGGGPTPPLAATLEDAPSQVEHQHLTVAGVTIGGVKVDNLQRVKANIEKGFVRVNALGDITTQQPVPGGMYEVTLELEWEWSGNSEYSGHLNGSFAAVAATFTDGTNAYALAIPRGQLGEVTRTATAPGVLRCSSTVKGYAQIGTGVMTLELTNGKATPETI